MITGQIDKQATPVMYFYYGMVTVKNIFAVSIKNEMPKDHLPTFAVFSEAMSIRLISSANAFANCIINHFYNQCFALQSHLFFCFAKPPFLLSFLSYLFTGNDNFREKRRVKSEERREPKRNDNLLVENCRFFWLSLPN